MVHPDHPECTLCAAPGPAARSVAKSNNWWPKSRQKMPTKPKHEPRSNTSCLPAQGVAGLGRGRIKRLWCILCGRSLTQVADHASAVHGGAASWPVLFWRCPLDIVDPPDDHVQSKRPPWTTGGVAPHLHLRKANQEKLEAEERAENERIEKYAQDKREREASGTPSAFEAWCVTCAATGEAGAGEGGEREGAFRVWAGQRAEQKFRTSRAKTTISLKLF